MGLTDEEKALVAEFRDYFASLGGNDPIELMERKVDVRVNLPVAMLQTAALSQLNMLARLRVKGKL